MNIALWIAAGTLAVLFLLAGLMKATQPKEKLSANMPWVEDFSSGQVKAIGIVEVLGAIGLIVPAATGIAPILTPLAAVGLVVTMLLAIVVHVRRNEKGVLPVNGTLLAVAAFVAVGHLATNTI